MTTIGIYLMLLFMPASFSGILEQPTDREIRMAREAFSEGIRKGVANDFSKALEHFNEAIRLDPLHTDAYLYRGLALIELAQYADALTDFETAIRMDGKMAEQANYFIGLAKSSLGQYHEAIHYFSEAIRISPDHYSFFQRGLAYLSVEEYGRALQDFDVALRLNPGFADAYLYRGKARYLTGLFAEALSDLLLAKNTFEDDGELFYFLGQTYVALGQEDEAATYLAKAVTPHQPARKEEVWEKETEMLNQRLDPPDLRKLEEGYYNVDLQEVRPRGIGIQMVTFTNPDRLAEIASGYQHQFGHPVYIHVSKENRRTLYKISIGNFPEREQAIALRSRLRDHGFLDSFLITYP